VQPFRKLEVWHKAHELTLRIYRMTEGFPKEETFGLAVQLRRSAISVPMKIVEACGRDDAAEFSRCLGQARGTGVELEYLMLLARDLQFMKVEDYDALQAQVIEVRKMLSGLMKTASV
jgi:four helix bundle protein